MKAKCLPTSGNQSVRSREIAATTFLKIDALQRRWLAIKREREEVSPGAYSAFLERLTRSWAIETGIIEGLYTLDPSVTENTGDARHIR